MSLKITKASEPITIEQIVMVLYSPPGTGKTSIAFTADKPLLLDFDGGSYRSANRGDVVQVKSWAEVSEITADDLKPYKTLVIDTAGRALDHLSRDIIRANPKMGRGGALTLQGFGELKAKFIAFASLVKSFGLDLVLIAHSDEQKNGDETVERLDVQGGSKNEIYKSSDMMGRLKIKNGKRVLMFNPTDTAFGKNPAGIPEVEVPNFAADPHFLAGLIAQTKEALNKQSEAMIAAAAELADWQSKFDEAKTVEHFNALIPEVEKASEAVVANAKRLLVSVAGKKGFAFDAKTKAFKAKTEEKKAEATA